MSSELMYPFLLSENPEMVNFKQYQEHHYCNTDNCNKNVMLGDGVQPIGEGPADGDQSDGAYLTIATKGLSLLISFVLAFL